MTAPSSMWFRINSYRVVFLCYWRSIFRDNLDWPPIFADEMFGALGNFFV